MPADWEDKMAHTLTGYFGTTAGLSRRPYSLPTSFAEDSLDSVRGVMAGVLISVLVFWLPLAFVLTR